MGLEILAKPGPLPRDLILKIKCDGDHGFLERADTFEGADFMALRSAATLTGWKETYALSVNPSPDGPRVGFTRLFLCPQCGRKTKGEVNG